MEHHSNHLSSWFAGPKAENAEWFQKLIVQSLEDYYGWRRNYFPMDSQIVRSADLRAGEPFRDDFSDALNELLARLKGDCPFHSPRYIAHMIAEQSLPSIAGQIAALLYNPNNVSSEAAPVTVQLENEAIQMLCGMLGFEESGWGHLTGGGTVANFEALWAARSLKYFAFAINEIRLRHGMTPEPFGSVPFSANPQSTLTALLRLYAELENSGFSAADVNQEIIKSDFNVARVGIGAVVQRISSQPKILISAAHHYCVGKALDLLGLGYQSLVVIPVDHHFKMIPENLETALDQVEQDGDHVLAVVGIVGTTEEGAIDPIDQILAIRAKREQAGRQSFWVHCDAAYGGYLRSMVTPNRIGLGDPHTTTRIGGEDVELTLNLPTGMACDALVAMREADSVTIDPHKLGYVPYAAGAICYRNEAIKLLLNQSAPYIGENHSSPGEILADEGVGHYLLEGSRPGATAASVWLSHKLIPLDTSGHGGLMQQTVRDACELHALLEHMNGLELAGDVVAVPLCQPSSNIVCFAFRGKSVSSLGSINQLNRAIYKALSIDIDNARPVYSQEFFVSRTQLSNNRYAPDAMGAFLEKLGVTAEDYERECVFLLRSVVMNPWYVQAKKHGRYYLAEFVEHLFRTANQLVSKSIPGF